MTARVVPIRPEPKSSGPGAFGLHWADIRQRDTGRWRAVARNGVHVVATLEIHSVPSRIPAEELAFLVAQLLNDIGEDAANLLLAAHFNSTPEEP